jgi:hypothetical protein
MTNEESSEWTKTMEKGGFARIPEGVYKAVLADLGKATVTDEDGTRPLVVFKFKISGGEHDGLELHGLASDKLSELSKLYKWLVALGVRVNVGERLDIRQAISHKAQIVVKDKKRTFNGETTVSSTISDVLGI